MAGVGWAKFNEKDPWGKSGKNNDVASIGEENLHFAQMRRAAEKGVKEGTATPEQYAIVADVKRLWHLMRSDGEEE